jgi:N-acyl-D-amino-acid deacylase
MRRFVLVLVVSLSCLSSCSREPAYDVVLRGGLLFDGTGAPGARGDLAIDGDRIVALGEIEGRGALEIDASRLYLAPGFTDMHS